MNSIDLARRYREARAGNPLMSATTAYALATAPDYSAAWQESSHHDARWTRDVDGFTVALEVTEESIFPMPDRNGSTDYGTYVDEARSSHHYSDEWRGNYPRPAEMPPLGLPYTSIRYHGPGYMRGEEGGYFIPDGIEDTFAYFRARGQSRAVAWDLTRADVESQLSMLFSSPLTYVDVTVTVSREGVELASSSMSTDISRDEEGHAYIFTMVNEHGMVEEAMDEARDMIARLAASSLADA